ncbi:MAG: hypothetical protein GF411_13990 [Candidatus Lokiarchaeota archaeon]|nr:hypothetical protein [Candidatus Lokiarchaeota archaeon]
MNMIDDPILQQLISKVAQHETQNDIDDIDDNMGEDIDDTHDEDIDDTHDEDIVEPDDIGTSDIVPTEDADTEVDAINADISDGNNTPEDDIDNDLNNKFNEMVNEVHQNYKQDRENISDFIEFLKHKIENDEGMPVRVYYESLSSCLRTKSESSATMIKLLDNINKRTNKESGGLNINLQELLQE